MTVQTPNPLVQVLPEAAPFSEEQRSWLNGFFAGLLSLDNAGVTALSPAQNAAVMGEADDGAPWHDPAMAIADRMQLADGKPLPRRLFAAMAQQDCGQCGYVCETYSAAIAEGKEGRLNLCAPGGKETLRQLKVLMEAGGALAAAPDETASAAPAGPIGRSRENPVLATFLSRRKLNGEGSEKETWHVEFDLSESGLDYIVGDAFGIVAQNDPRLVDAVIALLGARPDADIDGKALREKLLADCALGPAPDALFQLISYVTGGETRQKAKRLAAGEDPDGDLDRLDVLGALHKFSQARLSAEAFVEALDPLQPRLYSISSSHNATPGRITLTVDAVRYRIGTRPRWGVASTFLAERIAPGDTVPVYVQRAHGFGLPADPATPVIMCGPGTGIAPFRAFLHDRQATKAPGRNWLFFGHQRRACDFFYEEELQAMKDSGFLTNLTLAWSRDGDKVYVQDRMRERGAELWLWLEQGAHFYVCGDAKRMAKDVERAMVDVVAEHGKRSVDEAVAYVAALKKAGRYQADVY
ncbi:MAG TPA: sulfite reductase subunit alpha [Bosea sp. (in: a-proteobacteria)]|jgi:sulfite reductase (NADPH) flavoprotein alpha-component|uniref:sulfite reductase subunit alpha n=1 Tax=Bosea sp. (in: a-proteobacteria) TaxID=1871050 RepID=UPI002E1526EA|nr:sulfite reductase subunit alpha [Bosea sp. (in: a-proteobacteria)]